MISFCFCVSGILSESFWFLFVFKGHFVRKLGNVGDKETENEVLLLEHDIPHAGFSEAVLNCLPKLPWEITKEVRNFFVPCINMMEPTLVIHVVGIHISFHSCIYLFWQIFEDLFNYNQSRIEHYTDTFRTSLLLTLDEICKFCFCRDYRNCKSEKI